MKKALVILGCLTLMTVFLGLVWFVGMLFEFEYPYAFKLKRVQNAISANGTPISTIFASDGFDSTPGLHWHACSYCASWCGDHDNLISVRLDVPRKRTSYYFAYCSKTRTLVPMTDGTASRFPSLVPEGDKLEGVDQLNGKDGTFFVGSEELKLPAKWFRRVTSVGRTAASP